MKKFKDYLLESMSYQDALRVFDIKSVGTPDELKKKYRELSVKHHPDRGGSLDMMKKINAAYDELKKVGGTSSSIMDFDWDSAEKEKKEFAERVIKYIDDTLDIQKIKDYLENIISEKLTYTIDKTDPNKSGFRYHVKYIVNFSTIDGKKQFTTDIFVSMDERRNTGLGSSDTGYNMTVYTQILYNRKKIKLFNQEWNTRKFGTKSVLKNPEELFPEKKLKSALGKSKSKKFTKKDAILSISRELDTKSSDSEQWIKFDVKDTEKYIAMVMLKRSVIMREAAWALHGIIYPRQEENGRLKTIPRKIVQTNPKYISMNEIEEELGFIIDELKAMKRETYRSMEDVERSLSKVFKKFNSKFDKK